MDKKTEEELKEIIKERTRWRHFWQIVKRKYIWIPLFLILLYLKESPPIQLPIIDDVIKIISRAGGLH